MIVRVDTDQVRTQPLFHCSEPSQHHLFEVNSLLDQVATSVRRCYNPNSTPIPATAAQAAHYTGQMPVTEWQLLLLLLLLLQPSLEGTEVRMQWKSLKH
jgi:hypothetical protein